MVFFEKPTSWTVSSDPTLPNRDDGKFELKTVTGFCLEILFIIILTADMIIEFYIERNSSKRRKYWLMFHLLFAAGTFDELIANELTPVDVPLIYRKMLRPF